MRHRARLRPRCGRAASRDHETADGPGTPPEHRERVFERFYRGGGRGTDGGGAGLGLAIARWIVELHGDTIRAERREPHGTHMVVALPEARART